jgi:hypothetical protein
MKWAGYVTCMGEMRKATILVGRSACRWEDDIEMDLE